MRNIYYTLLSLAILFWTSRGQAQTLNLVADLNPGANSSYANSIMELNGAMYFVAGNGSGYKIYTSDGTTAGTTLVGPTDNPNGTVYHLTSYNGKLYFAYDDGVHGLELWSSDGTTAGTVMLSDIWSGTNAGGVAYSSSPEFLTVCNGLLFFQASTASRQDGLWVSDGTPGGTQMLGNQFAEPFASGKSFLVFEDKIYFSGNAGAGYGMWRSDGTQLGTQLVRAGTIGGSGGTYAVMGGKFYFQHFDNSTGAELWVSDGTSMGTQLVKDINTVGFSSDPQQFFTDGQKLYFTANNGVNGREWWVSDGTEVSTELLIDILPGAPSSQGSGQNEILLFNGQVYLFGRDGTTMIMYRTDGTTAGTIAQGWWTQIYRVPYTYVYNGKMYFVGAQSSVDYIYASDGLGATLITPEVAVYSSNPNGFNILGFNDNIYLPAVYNAVGNEFCSFNASPVGVVHTDQAPHFSVYPNPSDGLVYLSEHSAEGQQWFDIRVLNAQGEAVKQLQLGAGQALDLRDLPQGLYFIQENGQARALRIVLAKN